MISNEGLIAELDILLRHASVNASFRLFKNNITPDEDSVWGDFVEPVFTGYAPIAYSTLIWPGPSVVGGEVVTNGPLLDWTCSGALGGYADIVYGIFVLITDVTHGTRLWEFDLFDTPIPIDGTGVEVRKKLNFKRRVY